MSPLFQLAAHDCNCLSQSPIANRDHNCHREPGTRDRVLATPARLGEFRGIRACPQRRVYGPHPRSNLSAAFFCLLCQTSDLPEWTDNEIDDSEWACESWDGILAFGVCLPSLLISLLFTFGQRFASKTWTRAASSRPRSRPLSQPPPTSKSTMTRPWRRRRSTATRATITGTSCRAAAAVFGAYRSSLPSPAPLPRRPSRRLSARLFLPSSSRCMFSCTFAGFAFSAVFSSGLEDRDDETDPLPPLPAEVSTVDTRMSDF